MIDGAAGAAGIAGVCDEDPRVRRGGRAEMRQGGREAGRQEGGEERGRRRWRRGDTPAADCDLPSAVL